MARLGQQERPVPVPRSEAAKGSYTHKDALHHQGPVEGKNYRLPPKARVECIGPYQLDSRDRTIIGQPGGMVLNGGDLGWFPHQGWRTNQNLAVSEGDVHWCRLVPGGRLAVPDSFYQVTRGLEIEYWYLRLGEATPYPLSAEEMDALFEEWSNGGTGVHPTKELCADQGEVTTDNEGYRHPQAMTDDVIHYLDRMVRVAEEHGVGIYPGGSRPTHNGNGERFITDDEYINRIVCWLWPHVSLGEVPVNDYTHDLVKLIGQTKDTYGPDAPLDIIKRVLAHWSMGATQVHVSTPGPDLDVAIWLHNRMNGPVNMIARAVSLNAPFYEGRFGPMLSCRQGSVKRTFDTAWYQPELPSWDRGTKDNVLRGLANGDPSFARALLIGEHHGRGRVRDEYATRENNIPDTVALGEVATAIAELDTVTMMVLAQYRRDGETPPAVFFGYPSKGMYYGNLMAVDTLGGAAEISTPRGQVDVQRFAAIYLEQFLAPRTKEIYEDAYGKGAWDHYLRRPVMRALTNPFPDCPRLSQEVTIRDYFDRGGPYFGLGTLAHWQQARATQLKQRFRGDGLGSQQATERAIEQTVLEVQQAFHAYAKGEI